MVINDARGTMFNYVGLKLGNYHLIRQIGNGGFADVYLGEHIYLKTPAAIKVLRTQLPGKLMQNFLAEACNHARLSHPNIVSVLDFGIENNMPFLVMSYAPHGTLRQRYPVGSVLETAAIVFYVKQIAAGLQYAHNRQILHRDIKPENMLIGNEGNVLLSDFGISIAFHNFHNPNVPSLLSIGAGTAGTTTYMAPEQLHGTPYYASDQYALATVAYEWFCGTPPFTGSDLQIAVKHMYRQPPLLSEKIPEINPAIEDVMLKALAKNPQDRFASIQLFADTLDSASKRLSLRPFATVQAPVREIPVQQALAPARLINRNNGSLFKNYRPPLVGTPEITVSPYMQNHLASLAKTLPIKVKAEKSPSPLLIPAPETEKLVYEQWLTLKNPSVPAAAPAKAATNKAQTTYKRIEWPLLALFIFFLCLLVTIPIMESIQANIEKHKNQIIVATTTTHTKPQATTTNIPGKRPIKAPHSSKHSALPNSTNSLTELIASPTAAVAMPIPTPLPTTPAPVATPLPTAPAPVATPLPTTPAPPVANAFTIQPSLLSPTNCIPDNSNYRCTITLTLSSNYGHNLTWSANSIGVAAFLNLSHGTLAPGQSQQIITYVVRHCPANDSFVFRGDGLSTFTSWSC